MFIAMLLASAATGCSSDASRFGGLFGGATDGLTTNSIARGGQAPVPIRNVDASGGQGSLPQMDDRETALNQPYPQQPATYDPVSTSTISRSDARAVSSPVSVQRAELATPSSAPARPRRDTERDLALAQPFPSKTEVRTVRENAAIVADPVVTGTSAAGWSTANAPTVQLKSGESIRTLSNRYGVPEKEILRANGLKTASAAAPGQSIVIPTFGKPRNAAKSSAEAADVDNDGKNPLPGRAPEREVAVLPGAGSARDKGDASGDTAKAKIPTGGGKDPSADGLYVVKPGDSLAKIARETGTPVARLKEMNGLSATSIRVGQKLKTSGAAIDPADAVTTASVAPKAQAAPQKEVASASPDTQPQSYKAPVATQTVSDVEAKADTKEEAPDATGIGKYRWPVNGAVIAGYGDNVNGSRSDGIDISVPQGTPIKSAENGVVIYAGNGLKELGNTVLVRHDDGTVTVYGNADTLNVARGQKVQRGQTLAASGMSGSAKRPQVHFEVRKDASPVNPMTYLK